MRGLPPLALALGLWVALVGTTPSQLEPGDVLYRALADELQRSMAQLAVDGLEAPYFLAYRVDELEARAAAASFGSEVSRRSNLSRLLTVELRVGDYAFDNTNFLSLSSLTAAGSGSAGRPTSLPVDDNYREIRRQVWLATDRAYKTALEQLAQKRAALQNKTLAEQIDDFGAIEPKVHVDPLEAPAPPPIDRIAELTVDLSTRLKSFEALYDSYVSVIAGRSRTTILTSEGGVTRTSHAGARLVAGARTQAVDGLPLEDTYLAVADSFEELPDREVLQAEMVALGDRLTELRPAGLLDRYNGPVLFEPQAAAELVLQGFAPRLLSQRQPLAGDERLASALNRSGARDFKDRLGARVLPRFMAVFDDPLLAWEGRPSVHGSYEVDEQGVPARRTRLIERGYLKTLLSGRTPVVGVGESSGSWRGGGVMPSNLVFETATRWTSEELREELMLLVADRGAEFGVIVSRMGPAEAAVAAGWRRPGLGGRRAPDQISAAVVATKVFPDGREVPLRNVEVPDFSPAAFKDIIGVGSNDVAYSRPFVPRAGDPLARLGGGASFGGFGGPPLTTVVVPALLFEEVTLKKPGSEIPSLPIAGHPAFESSD